MLQRFIQIFLIIETKIYKKIIMIQYKIVFICLHACARAITSFMWLGKNATCF